ncbi:CYTH domain-containing protein [Candidatus Gracilibacteria bacterium]|nr:CYTH domain-containing protein [Candidatus Gracilibacteria bacterium]
METEAKYRLAHEAQLDVVAALTSLGDYQLQSGPTEDQHNIYFDSVDRRLQHARYSLRRRIMAHTA